MHELTLLVLAGVLVLNIGATLAAVVVYQAIGRLDDLLHRDVKQRQPTRGPAVELGHKILPLGLRLRRR